MTGVLPWGGAERETKSWHKGEFNSGPAVGKGSSASRIQGHLHNMYHILWETKTSGGEKPSVTIQLPNFFSVKLNCVRWISEPGGRHLP